MTNFAQLGIEVNSESAVQAADDLDKLVDSGKSAEDSARRVGAAWEKAVAGISSDTGQIVQELKLLNSRQDSTAQLMAKLAQSVTDASKAFTTASVGAKTMADAEVKVGESADQAKARLLALATAAVDSAKSQEVMSRAYEATAGSAAAAMRAQLDQAAAQSRSARVAATAAAEQEQLAAAERKATGAASDQTRELEKLLGTIDPTIAAFARLEKQQEDLAKFRKSGLLPEDDFNEYSAKLDAARSSLGGLSDGLGKTGISAKQTAAALRTVPMQVTDIVTSIAAGQPILMVALQQGGQLKDSFGGVGAAAKAMGGYVLGLVNPFTLAAAAAAALGVAYYQGSKEQDEFRKALVTTGNAAGTTTTELAAMAERVGSVTGTTGGAAAALAQIAATGKIAIDRFEEIAVAAVSFEKATGKAVSETVAEFARLADDPVRAVVELNDKYNFLTASVFEQIKAAKEQGDNDAAAAIAQEALAKAFTERSSTIKENLGTLERAWNDLAGAAKAGWDAILDIGRESNKGPDLTALRQELAYRKSLLDTGFEDDNTRSRIAAIEAEISGFEKRTKAEQESARAAAERARVQREGQAAYEAIQEDGLSKRDKMLKALEAKQIEFAKARAAGYAVTAEQEEKALKKIRESQIYKETDGGRSPVNLSTFNEAENALKSLVSNYQNSMRVLDASLKAGVITQQDYTLQKSALIDKERTDVEEGYKAQITALQSLADKSSTTGAQRIQIDQRIADTRQKMTQALQKLDADQQVLSLQSQERMAKETAAIEAYGQALDDNLKRTQDSLDLQLAGFGLGERTRQQFQEMLKIRQDYEKDLEKLERDHRLKRISDNEYAGEKKELEKWLSERLKLQEQYYADEDALRGDWQNGVSRAYNSYIEETKDIAGQTENLFSNALGGIEDAFVNLATTGKLSFKSLADSIIADLARMAAKAYITVPLLSALGLGGSTPSGGGGVSSMFGGGSSGGGLADLFSWGSKAYNVATSGFGSAVSAGWSAGEGFLGGMQGAISGGYNYISSGLSGLFGGGAASSLAGGAGSNVGYGLGQNLVGGSVGSASYAASSGFMGSGLSGLGTAGYGIGGALYGYQQSGLKGAATGGLGAAAGAMLGNMVLPGIGAIIGGALGGMLGGSLFGGDWVTKDTGLSLAVKDGDFLGKRYEYQKKKGGLFGKNKKRTRYSALDPETQAALDAT
ncbi:phage tail tape measure protein, partial [Pseudomonas kurunegalensis]